MIVEYFYCDLDTQEGMDKYLDEVSDKITDKMLEDFREEIRNITLSTFPYSFA